jgi:DNA-binding GntR family transcriptional regulator
VTAAPLLADALARIECQVTEEVTGGTHTIFLGRVIAADAGDGQPLAYFRGNFGRFEFALNDRAYAQVRALVMERQYAADSVLDPERLAATIDADETAVFYALTRLSSDGLVRRDPDRGYVVVPFDMRTCEEVFDARTAVELGAIALGITSVTAAMLERFQTHLDAMHSCMNGEEFADFEGYLDANYALHRGIVDLAGSSTLTAMFGALAIKSVMMRSFGATSKTSRAFIDAQAALVDALGRHDHAAAALAARNYGEMAKERMREIVREHGGVL